VTAVPIIMALIASAAPAKVAPQDLQLPAVERRVTPEGLTVLSAPRGPLPLVSVRLVIRAGSSLDPSGKEGIADFTARLLRRGTKKLKAEAVDEAVEFVGATLGLGCSEDALYVALTTPAEHLPEMLNVMAALVREPTFPEDEVASARTRVLAQLANEQDDPSALADRAFNRVAWGNHPYAHSPLGTAKSVKGFTREDLVRFHAERVGPQISQLVVVGQFEQVALDAAVDAAFGGWRGGPTDVPAVPAFEGMPAAGRVVIVDKPDQTQAQIRIAGPGMRRGHPDAIPATVMNTALGGGFTSRLMSEIRVKRGLTYGVYSGFGGLKAGGHFEVSSFTKTETARELVDVALSELTRARDKGFTPKELATARTYLAGLYPLRLETNDAVASSISDVELYGLGADWVQRYRSRVAAVDGKAAAAVARKYLLATDPLVVLVGKASELKPAMKGLGRIEVLKASEVE
jgi:zinc protease